MQRLTRPVLQHASAAAISFWLAAAPASAVQPPARSPGAELIRPQGGVSEVEQKRHERAHHHKGHHRKDYTQDDTVHGDASDVAKGAPPVGGHVRFYGRPAGHDGHAQKNNKP